MGACCCCCKKKKKSKEVTNDGNLPKKKKYKPSKEFYEMMQKNNVVRMVYGDFTNQYQAIIQILLECEDIAALLLIDKHERSGPIFDILRKIFQQAMEPADAENQVIIKDQTISSEFRKHEYPSRKDVFSKYVYENNNRDNKIPVDLKELMHFISNS